MKLKRKVQKFYEKSRIRQKDLGTVLEALWQGVAEKMKEENYYQKQECLVITKEMASKQSRKIPHSNALGKDRFHGFWIKKLTSLHERTDF